MTGARSLSWPPPSVVRLCAVWSDKQFCLKILGSNISWCDMVGYVSKSIGQEQMQRNCKVHLGRSNHGTRNMSSRGATIGINWNLQILVNKIHTLIKWLKKNNIWTILYKNTLLSCISMLSGKYCLDVKRISFQCQGCIFHSNAAPIQYFCNRREDTKLSLIGWWTKREPKTQLWCGYTSWFGSKRSGVSVLGFVMNSSYSTYSYDPITSITRLDTLVGAKKT